MQDQSRNDEQPAFEAKLRVIGLFVFWFLLALGLSATGLSLGLGEADMLVAGAFEALVLAFPPLIWVHLRAKQAGLSVESLMGNLPAPRAWGTWTVTGLALAGFGLGTGWSSMAFAAAVEPSYFRELVAAQADVRSAWPVVLVAWRVIDALLLAPFVLQLAFCGVVLRRFSYLWDTRRGVLGTVLLFALLHGLLHMDPVGSAALALMTCLLYLETRCLWVPMFVHGVASAAQLGAVAAVTGGLGPGDLVATLDVLRWPATVAALLSAPVLVIAARRSLARSPGGLPKLA